MAPPRGARRRRRRRPGMMEPVDQTRFYTDAYTETPAAPAALATFARERGIRSTAGAPLVTGDCLWGVVTVSRTRGQLLPAETEARLASFTQLVATAVADAESRAGLAQLAEFPALKSVGVEGSAARNAGVQELRNRRPDLKVEW